MPKKAPYHFSIEYTQCLDPNGKTVRELPEWANDKATCQRLYHAMRLMRAFDQKAVTLHRRGDIRTYPPLIGQEAIGVAIGHCMQKDDIFCPYYRDHATLWMRGVPLETLLTFWAGDERGNENPQCPQDLPLAIPIASQCTQGAGAAYALKYQNKPQAVLVSLGDGATSKGDFYEAINASGAQNLPIVFVVNNNQWAISTSRTQQTQAETIAQKGIAAGIRCRQVDGNDLFAMTQACDQALKQAREGQGPTLIEALTYRLGTHTTVEDDRQHPDIPARDAAWAFEPCKRIHTFLTQHHNWHPKDEEKLDATIHQTLSEALKRFQARSKPNPNNLFHHVFANPTQPLKEQAQTHRENLDTLEDCTT